MRGLRTWVYCDRALGFNFLSNICHLTEAWRATSKVHICRLLDRKFWSFPTLIYLYSLRKCLMLLNVLAVSLNSPLLLGKDLAMLLLHEFEAWFLLFTEGLSFLPINFGRFLNKWNGTIWVFGVSQNNARWGLFQLWIWTINWIGMHRRNFVDAFNFSRLAEATDDALCGLIVDVDP